MATDIVSQLIGASIRICGLALVAFVSVSVFRNRSSAARHAMWTVVLIGMLLQIPLEMVAPPILLKALPILPVSTQPPVAQLARPSVSAAHGAAPASHAREPVTFSRMSWRRTVTPLYLVISLLLFLRLAFGYWGLRKIVRGSRAVPSLGPNVFEVTRVVVPGSVGGIRPRWQESILHRQIKPAAVRAGVGKVGWHTFRHSYSCLLRRVGADIKVQQELLRHSTIQSTMNVYTRAMPDGKRAVNSVIVRSVIPCGNCGAAVAST